MVLPFIKPLETISARKGSIATIFADFVRLAACCLAPRHEVDSRSLSVREDEYMEIIRRYDKREVELMTQAFGEFILEAEKHPHTDILGTSWLEYSSKYTKQARGEFYTPPEICKLMAHMTGDAAGFIERGVPFTVCEPACGAGGMILAYHEQFAPDAGNQGMASIVPRGLGGMGGHPRRARSPGRKANRKLDENPP